MAQVEINEMFCFFHGRQSYSNTVHRRPTVGDKAAEVAANDTVPGSTLATVELHRVSNQSEPES